MIHEGNCLSMINNLYIESHQNISNTLQAVSSNT